MAKEKFDELDEVEKVEKIGQKITEVIGSIGIAMSVSTLGAVLLGTDVINDYISFVTGGTILTSPFVYFGLKKIKNKMDDRLERDMHHAGQMGVMLVDLKEKDRKIDSMTALFLNEILDTFEVENSDFPHEQLMNINQLLYLINCNYYDKITSIFKDMNREELIKRIITQTSVYLNDSKRKEFDETDVEKMLRYCIFIPDDLKQQIALEFKNSKVKVGPYVNYEIIRSDIAGEIAEYMTKKQDELKGIYTRFDIENGNDYFDIISHYTEDPHYIENDLGNPHGLDWDIDFLRIVVKTIVRVHRQELLKLDPNYSNFKLAASFIDNALTYTLVNDKEQVGQEEMLNSFKKWNYLPFDMKITVLNTIFTEENIDFSSHPFGISKKKKELPSQKIIEFRPNKPVESE